jgi:hypothetical protein
MTICFSTDTACEHGIQGQCLECLLLIEERLEEEETVCHHPEREADGSCEECDDSDVREYWHARSGLFI